MTRRQIVERIAADSAFALECFAILQDRYEHRAVGTSSMGWMASHASRATALAAKLASGEVSEKDRAEVAKLTGSYGKQLARAFRDRDLAARPELGAQAAVFGVVPGRAVAVPVEPATVAATASPSSVEGAPAVARKRGRPKGSKNKPADTPSPRRRRRS